MKRALAGFLAALALIGAVWAKAARFASLRAENRGLREQEKAHDRINEADLGIGASDGANVEWLRKFHKRNRR